MQLVWWASILSGQTQTQQARPDPAIEPIHSSITVVEKIAAEAPASIAILEGPQLQKVPGVNLDDRLRMIPGFSLFRRSSSLVAHPTTQGISLRGIGSSGTSRTLVLWDGIPLNDVFGGWIYWTRVSPDALGRVEVSRGASTSVFGDRALGGVIALFSREAEPRRLTASYEAGNRNTHMATAGYSHTWGRFAASGNGRAFTTDGFYLIPAAQRGAADQKATVRFVAGDTRFDMLGARQRLFLKMDMLVEERGNGTVLQRNSSSMGNVGAHYARDWNRDGISILGYHTRAEFRSSFSTILAGRNRETISSFQTVPATGFGGGAFWRHTGSSFSTLIGTDVLRVEGQSIDRFPAITRIGGGTLVQHGRFIQADAKAGPVRLYMGARHHVPGSGRQFFSPSLGLAAGYKQFRFRGSAYRSFRAPTLNELYREFRQGNAVTLANAQLKPERVFGAEAGVDWVGEATRFGVTFFRNEMKDLVTNVTLRTTPAEITRQRQNAAESMSRGFEIEGRRRWRSLLAEGSYLFADSHFASRLKVPQIPKRQGSAQISWSHRSTVAAFGVRSYALQFDDDLNRFVLAGYTAAQISLRQGLYKSLSAQVVVENMLNQEFFVAATPILQLGAPRMFRAGLRWDGRLW